MDLFEESTSLMISRISNLLPEYIPAALKRENNGRKLLELRLYAIQKNHKDLLKATENRLKELNIPLE